MCYIIDPIFYHKRYVSLNWVNNEGYIRGLTLRTDYNCHRTIWTCWNRRPSRSSSPRSTGPPKPHPSASNGTQSSPSLHPPSTPVAPRSPPSSLPLTPLSSLPLTPLSLPLTRLKYHSRPRLPPPAPYPLSSYPNTPAHHPITSPP